MYNKMNFKTADRIVIKEGNYYLVYNYSNDLLHVYDTMKDVEEYIDLMKSIKNIVNQF